MKLNTNQQRILILLKAKEEIDYLDMMETLNMDVITIIKETEELERMGYIQPAKGGVDGQGICSV